MKRYNIVKKVPILLLAGMLTVSVASWTVSAEELENAVSLEDGQEGNVPQIQSEPGSVGGEDEDEPGSGETVGDGTGTGSQNKADNDGTNVITQDGTDVDSQDETDDTGTDGNLQNGDGLTGDGSLPEGFPGDLSGPEGGSTALSQEDPMTGIAAYADENVFPMGTVLYVTPIESGENYDQLSTLMSMIADQFKVYDIRFVNMMDYSIAEPAGTVRISIPIPEGFDTAHLSVSKIGEDGTRTEMSFEIVDGKAVFETDSAGTFLIAQMKVLPESLAMTEKTARVELTKHSATFSSTSGVSTAARLASPKTGDDNDIAVWGGLMGAAVVLILVFVVIKRKK